MEVVILDQAASTIAEHARAAGPIETGGLLLGWTRSDVGVVVVAQATGPGRRAKQSRFGLVLDVADLQRAVDAAWDSSNGDVAYLGDWHLHHQLDPAPSEIDRAGAREIAANPEILVPEPLIMIVGEPPDGRWRCWRGPEMKATRVTVVPRANETPDL